jgi:hypothetical protein
MLSINAVYDGKRIIARKNLGSENYRKVIITFPDESDDEPQISNILSALAENGGAFDFLDNLADDIYSD